MSESGPAPRCTECHFSATATILYRDPDADTLLAHMAKAFPNHKIGARHGAHYLSLSRTGSLSGTIECRFQAAKATRRAAAKGVSFSLDTIDDKQLKAMAKSAKGTSLEAILNAEIEKRAAAAPVAETPAGE